MKRSERHHLKENDLAVQLARLQAWIDRNPNMRVIERKPMPPLGHFSMMRFGKAV